MKRVWRCSQTGRGRLENRIFGKSILPEDRPDQVFSGIAFANRIVLRHEPAICLIEMSSRHRFLIHSPLREENQRSAIRNVFFPGASVSESPSEAGSSLKTPLYSAHDRLQIRAEGEQTPVAPQTRAIAMACWRGFE